MINIDKKSFPFILIKKSQFTLGFSLSGKYRFLSVAWILFTKNVGLLPTLISTMSGESRDRIVIQFSQPWNFSSEEHSLSKKSCTHNVPRMCFALHAREVVLLKAKVKAVYNIKRIHLETRRPEF